MRNYSNHKNVNLFLSLDLPIIDDEFDEVPDQETHFETSFEMAHTEEVTEEDAMKILH